MLRVLAVFILVVAVIFSAAWVITSSLLAAVGLLSTCFLLALVAGILLIRYLTGSQLPDRRRVLTREQARSTYDSFGSDIRDSESPYGGPAIRCLIGASDFGAASAVFEYGCGPGRLARKLFDEELKRGCRYVAVDQSPGMAKLAQNRLGKEFEAGRCQLLWTSGDPHAPEILCLEPGTFDVFVSTYVLDLLSEEDVQAVLTEAWRLLKPGGRLCLAGITLGEGLGSCIMACLWEFVHWVSPATVGGCRHQELVPYLDYAAAKGHRWRVVLRKKVPGFGGNLLAYLWSEVVVALKEA